ncbi:PREDICTED: protein RRP5 homolog [Priapulus caudatus]|uniref:Protein RRP5 homolog n=1 Tax=Priapulus caudatus TaxID=37621 RepID=A0ABM1E6L5_PRICU|nr:PREDICTED: protein RRP5 homolog [Priapulus caudatus]
MAIADEDAFPRGGKRAKQVHGESIISISSHHEVELASTASNPKHVSGKSKKSKGSGQTEKQDSTKAEDNEIDTDLLKFQDESTGKSSKKWKTMLREKVRKKPVTPKKSSPAKVDSVGSGQVQLSYKTITPGMLILGCIKEVHDFELIVSLPGGIAGVVDIGNISDAYTHLLQNLTKGCSAEVEDLRSMYHLFRVGQLLRCKIIEVVEMEQGKKKVILTISPQVVNEYVGISGLRNRMTLSASVVSVEDHGYVMDIGVKGIQAFLNSNDASKFIEEYNSGESLAVGQHVTCALCINDSNKSTAPLRSVNLTADPAAVCKAMLNKSGNANVKLHAIVPGMVTETTVQKVMETGVIVKFLTYTGFVHHTQLKGVYESPSKYREEQKVKACVLHVHPTSKEIGLTFSLPATNPLQTMSPATMFPGLAVGDKFSEACVVRVDKGRGVYLQLNEKTYGFASLSNLTDKAGITGIPDGFSMGSSHKCRIIDFDPMDKVVVVALKKSVFEQQFLRYHDIAVGSVVKCIVRGFHQAGMSVKLSDRIFGFVPNLHSADVALTNPARKYKKGNKLTCRVLMCDTEKSRLLLSNKQSIVTTKLPVLCNYEDAQPEMLVEGVIVQISTNYVLVLFCNDVKGLIPRKELSDVDIRYPEKVFSLGQVVKCRVLSADAQQKQMTLSMKNMTDAHQQIALPKDFEIGKLVNVKVESKSDTGLNVKLLPSGLPAFLPLNHLSDHLENCQPLHTMYWPGDTVHDCVYIDSSGAIIVSRKKSYTQAKQSGLLVSSFSDIKPDMLVVGCLKKVMDYGVFVELPGSVTGLVPTRLMADKHVTSPALVYRLGQSLIAKVTEVNQEKKRFLLNLKLKEVHDDSTAPSINLLEDYLHEHDALVASGEKKGDGVLKQLAKVSVGDVVETVVHEKTSHGVLCALDSDVRGFATNAHIPGEQSYNVGDQVAALVLHIDLTSKCLELSLDQELVKHVNNFRDTKHSKIKPDQLLRSEVLLIHDNFTLVALKGHGLGRLAYLPVKRHLNDMGKVSPHLVGQVNNVVVKRLTGGRVLASLQLSEKMDGRVQTIREQASARARGDDFWTPTVAVGKTYNAEIASLHDLHAYVKIGFSEGRIHASEVVDELEDGGAPLRGLETGSLVKVRVIGSHEVKTHVHRHLAITRPYKTKTYVDCSLKPSKVDADSDVQLDYLSKFKPGQKVQAFVESYNNQCLWMQVSPKMTGKVHLLNVSDDPAVLEDPTQHMLLGTGYNATVVGMDKGKVSLSLTGTTKLVEGTVVNGMILKILPAAFIVQLPFYCVGKVAPPDASDIYSDTVMESYHVGQFVRCCVLHYDETKKNQVAVSLRDSRVFSDSYDDIDREVTFAELRVGQLVKGYVTTCSKAGLFVSLAHNITGRVKYSNLSEYIVKGSSHSLPICKVVTAKVIAEVESRAGRQVELSLLPRDTGLPDIIQEDERGLRRSKTSSSKTVKKKRRKTSESGLGAVDAEAAMGEANPELVVKKKKKMEKEVELSDRIKVGGIESGDVCQPKGKKRKLINEGDSKGDSSKNKATVKNQQKKVKVTTSAETATSSTVITKVSPQELENAPRLQVHGGFSWDTTITTLPTPGLTTILKVPSSRGSGNSAVTPKGSAPEFHDDSSSSGSDDEKELPKEKTKKLTQVERVAAARRREEDVYNTERRLLDNDWEPEAGDDYEKMVLASPNSSIVWLRYMAFYLQAAETERARSIAERALQTISFREEQERLNVWTALLNLENMYGTPASLNATFSRALQANDALKVYLQLINIYCHSDKNEQAEILYNTVVKKFGQTKDVWIKFGTFYMKNGQTALAQKVLDRSLKSLDKRQHVDVIAKFAQLEFQHGELERGKTMFESMLGTYPRRTDLWSVYIDMMIKAGQHDSVRQLFDRVIHMKLSARKMKFFFKKYLEFEERHGMADGVSRVRELALDYVESQDVEDD